MYYDKKKKKKGSPTWFCYKHFCKYVAEIKHYLNVSQPNVSWLYLPSISGYAAGQSSVLNVGSEHLELNWELWKLTCTPSSLFFSSLVTCASGWECSPLSLTWKLGEICLIYKMHLVKVLTWTSQMYLIKNWTFVFK